MLVFSASGNFLTTGQGPRLCANEFQIGGPHWACVRKVAQCRGSWVHGRKFSPPPHTHTRGGRQREGERERNEEKPVVNKYWLLRLTGIVTNLCTPSEILADLQKNQGVHLYHTQRGSYGKMENTTSLDLGVPPFNHRQILCTKILNQLKMFQQHQPKSLNFLH